MICAFIEYNGRDDSQTLGSLPFMDFEINGQCSKKKKHSFWVYVSSHFKLYNARGKIRPTQTSTSYGCILGIPVIKKFQVCFSYSEKYDEPTIGVVALCHMRPGMKISYPLCTLLSFLLMTIVHGNKTAVSYLVLTQLPFCFVANESTRKRVILYTVGEYLLLAAVSALQVIYIRRLFSKSVAYNRVWVRVPSLTLSWFPSLATGLGLEMRFLCETTYIPWWTLFSLFPTETWFVLWYSTRFFKLLILLWISVDFDWKLKSCESNTVYVKWHILSVFTISQTVDVK